MFIEIKGLVLVSVVATVLFLCSPGSSQTEIREYEGKRLDPFDRAYDNSIKGPQHVDPETYRLEVTGLVEDPQSLTYQQVLSLPVVKRAVTLHCVEGWKEQPPAHEHLQCVASYVKNICKVEE